MIDMEILEEFSGSSDQMIVKGKRTKRLRPSSSTSSSGGAPAAGCSYNSLVSSPTTSSGISTITEEDEDMANCLILLARGGFSTRLEEETKPPKDKFSSLKFTEMATTTNGKFGIDLYECKTCSRTFPSFQALGGHRASHKKPKPTVDVDQKKSLPVAQPPPVDNDDDEEEEEEEGKFTKLNAMTLSTSTQLPKHVVNKPKIHECSICGSKFSSGQALGGHMRRHRFVINGATARIRDDSSSHDVGEKTRNMLSLDLNLPAPPEDDRLEPEFHRFSSNQQPRLVFSAAALVDCHY